MNRSGHAYLTPATLDARWMVRVSLGAFAVEREHVKALWSLLERVVEGGSIEGHPGP